MLILIEQTVTQAQLGPSQTSTMKFFFGKKQLTAVNS